MPPLRPARRRALVTVLSAALLTAACAPTTTGAGAGPVTASAATTTAATTAPTAAATPDASATPDPTATATATPTTSATSAAKEGSRSATAVLATLAVKGRAPMTGYDRDEFGPAWADVDHNGCDTRNDVLARDLTARTTKAGTHGCVVLTGTLVDPYSGRTIHFVRGVSTSTAVQIDHVVALADAWQTGAQKLSADQREQYANDPYVLLAADGPLNEQKGAGDAATWLPPNKPFRCAYVARQIGIKAKYRLWVTPAEHDAMVDVLASCPGQKVPSGGGAVVAATKGTTAPKATTSTKATGGGTQAVHPSVTSPVSHWDCPSWAPIKGNASSHIYHLPSGALYDRTAPEVCFATEAAAAADGYRASKR